MSMPSMAFSEEQLETMRAMRREGKSYKEIGKKFNCARMTIYKWLSGKAWQRASKRSPERGMRVLQLNLGVPNRVEVSETALADRDRRLLARRDLTASIMGDPPPGWSALDRR